MTPNYHTDHTIEALQPPVGNPSPEMNEVEQELRASLTRMRLLCAELLRQHTRAEVESMLEMALLPPPKVSPVDGVGPERYAAEYRKAEEALRRERQEVLGVRDVVRALLMLVESPEERVRKNLPVGVED
jgi:hypothetical protein